jgi:transcriptional regulator with XRE-family HTH domain
MPRASASDATAGFRDVGSRLRRHRDSAGLSIERVAEELGVSRALLYRYEAGNIVKLDVLARLAQLYGTSTSALLGLGSEYVTSGISFFERLQSYEEKADHMTVAFGPLAYVLTTDGYDNALTQAMVEPTEPGEAMNALELQRLMRALKKRKATFRYRKPGMVNIVPVGEVQTYLAGGMATRTDLPYAERNLRRRAAAREIDHMASMIAAPPMGVQIGLTRRPLPTTGFQILRLADRKLLVMSPFRVGGQPNLRYGVATISEDEEALRLHETLAARLWETALTGPKALDELAKLQRSHRG